MNPNQELFNKLKDQTSLSINYDSYSITGYKDSTTTDTPLVKFTLQKNGHEYLLELQFYKPCRIILWQEIPDTFKQSEIISYKGKDFKLVDKGISEIKESAGAGEKYQMQTIYWWDYTHDNEYLSLGRFGETDKWENLHGVGVQATSINNNH